MPRAYYTPEAANRIYDAFVKSGLTQTEYAAQVKMPKSSLSSLCVSVKRARAMMQVKETEQAERAATKLQKTMANTAEKMAALKALPPIEMPSRQEPSRDATLVEALARENAALKRMLASNWGYSQAV